MLELVLFCDVWGYGLMSVWACAGWLLVGLDLLIMCLWPLGGGGLYVCGCGFGVCWEVGLGLTGLAGIMDCKCWVGGVVCGSWLFGVVPSLMCVGVPCVPFHVYCNVL